MNTASPESLAASLLTACSYPADYADFGPLWRGAASAPYVTECFVRYARNEGHDFSGRTVAEAAQWLVENHYEGSGEEHKALACLLRLGCGAHVLG